ncbi:gypsy type transposase [Tanacetum coccineum]
MKPDGTIDKYKARLVIKGFRQREGLDYFDTYSPIMRITLIRMTLAIAALRNLEVHQMDVTTAFLNRDLEEEIYMNQPEGFIAPGQEGKVCRLVKSLYGLKQAPKQWHQKFDHTMLESGFKINECDNNDKIIKSTKDMLKSKFDMKDMGLPDHSNPSDVHCKAMTRVLHYLRYNRDYGLHYDRYPAVIEGYSDAKWIFDIKDSRSTSGYMFTLGGAAISWKSSKQTVIAKSTIESEFITAHSTMYNGKSRHIRHRQNSIRQLLSTGVISIDYVKSKDNITDSLMKGLSRELSVFPIIVDWRKSALKDEKPAEGSYSVEDVARLDTRHIEEPAAATESFRRPSTIKRSPLDFANENPSQQINKGDRTKDQVLETGASKVPPTKHTSTTGVTPNIVIEEEDAADVPLVSKRHCKRVNDGANKNAQPKILRKDFDVSHPEQSTFRGKSFASTGLEAGSTLYVPTSQGTPAGTIDPDPLFFAEPQPAPVRDIAESSKGATVVGDPNSEKSSSFTSFSRLPGYFLELRHLPNEEFLNQYNVNLARQVAMGSQLQLRFEQEVRLLKKAKEKGLRNQTRILETLLEAEVDMKKAVEANSAELTRELASLYAKFADLQVNNNELFQQVSTLQAQVMGEEQIKDAFEEFKKHEDDKLERRCTEIDALLDALSIDFDEELYPHMLTAIAGYRWVIGHGLRLAVMKCAESTDLRQAFANFVSIRIAKGVSQGLKHGVEHVKAQLDLEVIEAYDPEADAKYVAALHALKDLKYPLIDHLEKLKDAPIDLIMASLHLESDVWEETPQ